MFTGGGVVFSGGVSGLLVAPWGGGEGLRGALSAGGKGSVSAPPGWFVSVVRGSWAGGVIDGAARSTGSEAGMVIGGTAQSTGSEAGGVKDSVGPVDVGGPGVSVVGS